MKRLKPVAAILIGVLFCFSAFAFLIGTSMVTAGAQPNAAADADAATIRVLLSTGDKSELSFTLDGAYSVGNTVLPSGKYTVRNNSGTMNVINSSNKTVASNANSIMVTEHQNPDPSKTNMINSVPILVKGEVVYRNYLGSMKFWADGSNIDAVSHVYLEKYLYGVVAYEMNDNFPPEALKAQAVAARCYAYKRLEGTRDPRYDIGDTSGDQVYKGYNPDYTNVKAAVDATAGKVLTYNNAIITAYFAASNGGQTDRTENVWSAVLPYFKIRDDPYDLANPSSLQKSVSFPVGTDVDKVEDMPSLSLQPLALGEVTGTSKAPLYYRADTGRGKSMTLKRGDKFFIYERNSAWTKAKTSNNKVGFIPTQYTKIYSLQASISAAKKKLVDKPSSKGTKVVDVPKDAQVTILTYGTWCKVSYNGYEGYISKSYLKLMPNPATPPAVNIQPGDTFTATGTTYLRATPKALGKKVIKLPSGARPVLLATGNGWYSMSYKDKTGYVDTRYIQLVIPSLVLTGTEATTPAGSTENIHYTQDDLSINLVTFLKDSAASALADANKKLPEGRKYYTTTDTIKVKRITTMKGIQTDIKPNCVHNPSALDSGRHTAQNCPSIDFTGAKMTIILKVKQEDASKEGGFDRVDYTWDFEFKIPETIKSASFPLWQAFDPASSLRIFAVEPGKLPNGLDCYNLINRRFGHGIGLSQRGAEQRAKSTDPNVNKYDKILSFYYPGTAFKNLGLVEAPLTPLAK